VETLRSELRLDGCSLRAYDPRTEVLGPVVGCGYRAAAGTPLALSANSGIAGKAIRERRAMFVENPEDEKEFVAPSPDSAPVKSLFCVPLIEQGEVVGVLSGSSQEIRRFTPHEQDILKLIASRLTTLLRVYRSPGPQPSGGS